MKALLRVTLGVVLTLAVGLPAQAQWVVFDPTNFTQNLQQVAHMLKQLQALQQQISIARNQYETARSQLQGLTGHRGMGRILTDTARGYIPRTWQETLAAGGQVASLAKDIKSEAGYLSDANLSGVNSAYRDALRASGDSAINGMAANAAVFQESGARFQRLQVLVDKIETTDDPKAIADLQARIEAEQVMLQNELIRAQSMNAMIVQQQQVAQQRQRQQAASENFNYSGAH